MTNLSLFNEFRHGADGVFDGNFRIDAMQVIKIDVVRLETPQRILTGPRHILRLAFHLASFGPRLAAQVAEFARQDHFAAPVFERLGENLFVVAVVVIGSVDKIDADIDGPMQHGDRLHLPDNYRHIEAWRVTEFRSNQVITLPRPGQPSGHLLLVASSELPVAFYTGTLTARLGILIFSVLLWLIIARQIKRLITRPIHELEELSRQVTREENYALRAGPGNHDEIGSLAEAFNTMLSRIEAREQQLKRARDDSQIGRAHV